ncbi:UBX domain-containing protein 11 isoform X3 [Mustela erminea]|uniref:UBX domain-containing protein 11 isoform X3 n=1 Tax=Mustela erminea TaxID=36723 RepID=UPI0013868E46|nr:UBX domain-containing protein 11 isoform X3 [Mustela erminea]
MGSPLASLGKTRRVPLQSEPVNPARRGIKIYGDEDEADVLNNGLGPEEKIAVPSCYGGIGAPVSRQVPVFRDSELVATLTKKMRDLERQVRSQTDELLSKVCLSLLVLLLQDRKIRALEEMVQNLQEHQGQVRTQQQQDLETTCLRLQRQVEEMERFLGDYGLQWVGESADQEGSDNQADSEDGKRDWMTAKKFWKPGDSLAPPEVDFDRLLASLKDLSELVVDGDTQVTPMPGGARLHVLEPIPLKLYRNGLMMFDGPFRPFRDPSTQRCLRDLLDGFFPSELQRLYPNGVPFKVSDLRNQVYPENGLDPFPGEGRVVGRQRIHKLPDRMEHPAPPQAKAPNALPAGSKMTPEKFLNRLPKFVIRQGEVVDIRGPIRDTLQNCCPWPAQVQEIVVETPALAAERERSQESPESPAPLLSMLRIKSENGEKAFLLMMRPEDTVGDGRGHHQLRDHQYLPTHGLQRQHSHTAGRGPGAQRSTAASHKPGPAAGSRPQLQIKSLLPHRLLHEALLARQTRWAPGKARGPARLGRGAVPTRPLCNMSPSWQAWLLGLCPLGSSFFPEGLSRSSGGKAGSSSASAG